MNTRQFSCQLVFIKQRVEMLSLLKNLAIDVSVKLFLICFQFKCMALVIYQLGNKNVFYRHRKTENMYVI